MWAKSVFVTGANRGIGLEMIKQLARASSDNSNIIIAACRNPSDAKELNAIAEKNSSVHIVKLDVTNFDSYKDVVNDVRKIVKHAGLSLLINNAGVCPKHSTGGLEHVTVEQMKNTFDINTVAPLFLTKEFLPLLKQGAASLSGAGFGAAVVNITSQMGSIADNASGGAYAYRTSKTALNMVTYNLSMDLKPMDILAIALHPGWVQTDMGGPSALISVAESVEKMLKFVANMKKEDNGKFVNFEGKTLPW